MRTGTTLDNDTLGYNLRGRRRKKDGRTTKRVHDLKIKLARVFPRPLVCAYNVLVPVPVDEHIFMASVFHNVGRRLLMFFY